MRIIGYLNVPECKVTVFQQGMRYTVKFEDGLYEQSYKFRESDEISGLSSIRSIIDEEFVAEVKAQFKVMRNSMKKLMDRHFSSEEEEEFEDII
jgi:hypothetical protein